MAKLAVLATIAALALTGCRAVSVRDDAYVPVRVARPETVAWNFSSGWGPWRGTWQLPESDMRLGPSFYDGSSPEQIKVIYYGQTEVLITWSTGNSSTYVGPVVQTDLSVVEGFSEVQIVASAAFSRRSPYLQASLGGLVRTARGDVDQYTYNYDRSIPGAANYTSGVLHHVRVGDLEPGVAYSYRVGSELSGSWSNWLSFEMPGNASVYPISFGLIGDGGQTTNSSTTYDRLLATDPKVVVWLGDLSYSDTRFSNGTMPTKHNNVSFPSNAKLHKLTKYGTYQPRWDMWGRLVQPLTSTRPFVYIVGNHEIERQSNGVRFSSFRHRVPPNSDESGSTLYFSYNIGPVHWVFLTSYTRYDLAAPQTQWLINDLENVDRTVTPWVIVGQHAPMYNSYKAHYQEAECYRMSIEPILFQYNVDMVFSGHVHAYERSFPVYNYALHPTAPVHITVGDGGNVEKLQVVFADLPGHCPKKSKRKGNAYQPEYCLVKAYNGKFCSDGQPFWSAFREPSFGFATLDILNETTAHFQWHRNQDDAAVVADDVYFVRTPTFLSA